MLRLNLLSEPKSTTSAGKQFHETDRTVTATTEWVNSTERHRLTSAIVFWGAEYFEYIWYVYT